jgi:hypothetical protein
MYIWFFLSIAAVIALYVYWHDKNGNAVWGAVPIGIVVGLLSKFVFSTDWYIIVKTVVVAVLLGTLVQVVGKKK